MLNDHLDTELIADLRRQLARSTTECDQLRGRLSAAADRHSEDLSEARATAENARSGFERIAVALGLPAAATVPAIVAAIERETGRLRS